MDIIFQATLNIAFLIVALFALLGAVDFIKNSWIIFRHALRRYREHSDRE